MNWEQVFQRLVDDTFSRLRNEGLARRCSVRENINFDSWTIEIETPHGERLGFRITRHEMAMGRVDAVRYFLDTVRRDCRTYCERAGWPNSGYYAGRENDHARIDALYGYAVVRPELHAFVGVDFVAPAYNEAAQQKSRDLFILGAGQKAFKIIDAGKPLPITGSEGTKYTLHKRAAYCVERKNDGAKLCAVVPGVPLYDHLLGIKIMVENDEPKFLKIANVSPGDIPRGFAWNNWI